MLFSFFGDFSSSHWRVAEAPCTRRRWSRRPAAPAESRSAAEPSWSAWRHHEAGCRLKESVESSPEDWLLGLPSVFKSPISIHNQSSFWLLCTVGVKGENQRDYPQVSAWCQKRIVVQTKENAQQDIKTYKLSSDVLQTTNRCKTRHMQTKKETLQKTVTPNLQGALLVEQLNRGTHGCLCYKVHLNRMYLSAALLLEPF